MAKTCCFCISLQTGTLLLAILGLIGSILAAILLIKFGSENSLPPAYLFLPGYFILTALAALSGILGVLSKGWRAIMIFGIFAFIELILAAVWVGHAIWQLWGGFDPVAYCKDRSRLPDWMTPSSCTIFVRLELAFVSALLVSWIIIKAHFAIVIWQYSRILKRERDDAAAAAEIEGFTVSGDGRRYGTM